MTIVSVIEHIDPFIQDTSLIVENTSESIKLSFIQRIILRLFGHVRIGERMKEGWSSSLPLYAFRCEEHGLQCNHPIGHAEYLLCPECPHLQSARE